MKAFFQPAPKPAPKPASTANAADGVSWEERRAAQERKHYDLRRKYGVPRDLPQAVPHRPSALHLWRCGVHRYLGQVSTGHAKELPTGIFQYDCVHPRAEGIVSFTAKGRGTDKQAAVAVFLATYADKLSQESQAVSSSESDEDGPSSDEVEVPACLEHLSKEELRVIEKVFEDAYAGNDPREVLLPDECVTAVMAAGMETQAASEAAIEYFTAAVTAGSDSSDSSSEEDDPKLPSRTSKKRPTYSDETKKAFVLYCGTVQAAAKHVHVPLGTCLARAKKDFPALFPPTLKYDTAKAWEFQLQKAAEAKEAKIKKAEKRKADEAKARELKKARGREAPTMSEKAIEVETIFGTHDESKKSIHSAGCLMAVAMVLYSLFLAGVPMTSALALPVILAKIKSLGFGHQLHSKQSCHPLDGTLKSNGLQAEKGKMLWTRRVVNLFYQKIGLSMRNGTKNFSKAKKPEEVEDLRQVLFYRLLFVMVTKKVAPAFTFQMDETGVPLLKATPHMFRHRCQLAQL